MEKEKDEDEFPDYMRSEALKAAKYFSDKAISPSQIMGFLKSHLRCKAGGFGAAKTDFTPLHASIEKVINQPERSPFSVLHHLLLQQNIPFKVRYRIGAYRVDFLLQGFIAVDIYVAGPPQTADAKRNTYLTEMGYFIFSVDARSLVENPEEAVNRLLSEVRAIADQAGGDKNG